MFNSAAQMIEQIRAGEDGRAEFKELRLSGRRVTAPHTEDLAGELVAFANAEGGAVFLGVDDAGAVTGIPADRLDAVDRSRRLPRRPVVIRRPHPRRTDRRTGFRSDRRRNRLRGALHAQRRSAGRRRSLRHRRRGRSGRQRRRAPRLRISGSKIRLFLFADRLELHSPGKLPNTITLDDMPYRTFTRNQLLVNFLLFSDNQDENAATIKMRTRE